MVSLLERNSSCPHTFFNNNVAVRPMYLHEVRKVNDQLKDQLEGSGLNPVLAKILASRGLTIEEYESQSLGSLPHPSLLKGVHEAAQTMASAIINKKKIVVSSDFDVDGATSAAIAVRGMRMIAESMGHDPSRFEELIDFIVPNRFEFGYGLSKEIVDHIKREKDPYLIVTVDNGQSSIEGVLRAKELGMRTVVTDHHLPGDQSPDADAIVNPNQHGCNFPSKNIAGCGVIFYTLIYMRSMLMENGYIAKENKPRLDKLFDLLALGTVADVVKLDKVNRTFVDEGLRRIRAGFMNEGIRALFKICGKDPSFAVASDFGFGLGPRLNAAGRLADMTVGIKCLLTNSAFEAERLAGTLNEMNVQRKEIESEMKQKAEVDVQEFSFNTNKKGMVVAKEGFHHGVIGIIASRIKEQTYRPTIVFAPEEGTNILRGSGRSIEGVHLRDVIDLVNKRLPSGAIVKFGGHAMACGLSLVDSHLDAFTQQFERALSEMADPSVFNEVVMTDGAIDASLITVPTASSLEGFIWGQGFPPPLFSDTFEVLSQKILKEKHSKFVLQKDGKTFEALRWNSTETLTKNANLAFRVELNRFRDEVRVQLIVDRVLLQANPDANLKPSLSGPSPRKRVSSFGL